MAMVWVMVTVTRFVWRTLIHQTQGLSADVIGRTNPEGVRQSSADSELRRGYDKKIKKRGGTKVFRHLMSYFSQRKNHGTLQQIEYEKTDAVQSNELAKSYTMKPMTIYIDKYLGGDIVKLVVFSLLVYFTVCLTAFCVNALNSPYRQFYPLTLRKRTWPNIH